VQVPHAFGQDQLIAPLGKYLSRYPNVSVEWVLHDRSPNFTAEGIDCAIQVGVIEDPSVVAIRLGEVPRIVVTHPALAGDGPLPSTTEQLQRLPWLALRTYYTDEVVLTCQADGRSHRFAIQPRMSTDSLYALRSAALAGLGACVSSAWVVAQDIEEGRLIQLVPQWRAAPLPVYLIYPHARSYPAKLRLFAEIIRTDMPNLVGMTSPGIDALQPASVGARTAAP
jgi:DNA-binding transcriptional LysR family regulator